MNKLIFYDKENDILAIHKGFSDDEKFKGNIDIGDIILDVSTKGKIKGIELINTTSLFEELEISKEILKNITKADFKIQINPNRIIITILIKAKNAKQKIPAKIAVPLEVPIKKQLF